MPRKWAFAKQRPLVGRAGLELPQAEAVEKHQKHTEKQARSANGNDRGNGPVCDKVVAKTQKIVTEPTPEPHLEAAFQTHRPTNPATVTASMAGFGSASNDAVSNDAVSNLVSALDAMPDHIREAIANALAGAVGGGAVGAIGSGAVVGSGAVADGGGRSGAVPMAGQPHQSQAQPQQPQPQQSQQSQRRGSSTRKGKPARKGGDADKQ